MQAILATGLQVLDGFGHKLQSFSLSQNSVISEMTTSLKYEILPIFKVLEQFCSGVHYLHLYSNTLDKDLGSPSVLGGVRRHRAVQDCHLRRLRDWQCFCHHAVSSHRQL